MISISVKILNLFIILLISRALDALESGGFGFQKRALDALESGGFGFQKRALDSLGKFYTRLINYSSQSL
jgi:hypothetical protein